MLLFNGPTARGDSLRATGASYYTTLIFNPHILVDVKGKFAWGFLTTGTLIQTAFLPSLFQHIRWGGRALGKKTWPHSTKSGVTLTYKQLDTRTESTISYFFICLSTIWPKWFLVFNFYLIFRFFFFIFFQSTKCLLPRYRPVLLLLVSISRTPETRTPLAAWEYDNRLARYSVALPKGNGV